MKLSLILLLLASPLLAQTNLMPPDVPVQGWDLQLAWNQSTNVWHAGYWVYTNDWRYALITNNVAIFTNAPVGETHYKVTDIDYLGNESLPSETVTNYISPALSNVWVRFTMDFSETNQPMRFFRVSTSTNGNDWLDVSTNVVIQTQRY